MEMIVKMEAKLQMTVILLLWLWWDERNKWREEGKRRNAAEIAYITAALSDKFKANKTTGLLSDFRQVLSWKKQHQGELKINSDGAFNPATGSGGRGFIIRDDQGLLVRRGRKRDGIARCIPC